MADARCDALVIGGGPGGLTGALYLARVRRRVLVVDDGASRAARIPHSRNYPGFVDGIAGAELVAAMRAQ
ncbi:MAG TPA: NAD(P)-binding protein, partial [Ideonella sp.]|nr:NAD(P)-binding protein [Ideonella sp.]